MKHETPCACGNYYSSATWSHGFTGFIAMCSCTRCGRSIVVFREEAVDVEAWCQEVWLDVIKQPNISVLDAAGSEEKTMLPEPGRLCRFTAEDGTELHVSEEEYVVNHSGSFREKYGKTLYTDWEYVSLEQLGDEELRDAVCWSGHLDAEGWSSDVLKILAAALADRFPMTAECVRREGSIDYEEEEE